MFWIINKSQLAYTISLIADAISADLKTFYINSFRHMATGEQMNHLFAIEMFFFTRILSEMQ